MTAAVASTPAAAMPTISQKPDRVSNILRSSTPTTVRNGMGSCSTRGRAGARSVTGAVSMTAVWLMPPRPLVRCLR